MNLGVLSDFVVQNPMTAQRKYRQLKLEILTARGPYAGLHLAFRLGKHTVYGRLNGSAGDWVFESTSPAFLKQIPQGRLYKYNLWYDAVPRAINSIYNGILESAFRAGFDLYEND